MISFSFMSRDKRSKTASRPRSSAPTLEQQLFGKPRPAPGVPRETGTQDWVRSSLDLRDGCEVRDVDLDTLPADLLQSFRR